MPTHKKFAALVLVVCMSAAAYLGWLAVEELMERKSGESYYETLSGDLPTAEPSVTPLPTLPLTLISGSEQPTAEPTATPAPTLVPMNIDFDSLHKTCKDVVGWIRIDGTPVDYPVVLGENNQFYLNHLPNGTKNSSGSIMMDIACREDFTSMITILHGHNMRSGAMFGSLDLYYRVEYFEEHPVLQLATPEGEWEVQIFAGYTVDGETFGYPTGFATEEEFDVFVSSSKRKSMFNADVDVQWGDRLLLMSTCAYTFDTARFVVIGKIVENPS